MAHVYQCRGGEAALLVWGRRPTSDGVGVLASEVDRRGEKDKRLEEKTQS